MEFMFWETEINECNKKDKEKNLEILCEFIRKEPGPGGEFEWYVWPGGKD